MFEQQVDSSKAIGELSQSGLQVLQNKMTSIAQHQVRNQDHSDQPVLQNQDAEQNLKSARNWRFYTVLLAATLIGLGLASGFLESFGKSSAIRTAQFSGAALVILAVFGISFRFSLLTNDAHQLVEECARPWIAGFRDFTNSQSKPDKSTPPKIQAQEDAKADRKLVEGMNELFKSVNHLTYWFYLEILALFIPVATCLYRSRIAKE